jgi:hypothetical protein|tara:strand:+ start:179 stop:508 length:330 start_codon:yes stop_codon:yes gene_type:complete
MNRIIYAVSALAACMALSTMIPASFGYGDQYGSENTNTGAFGTLEEQLELAERKVATAASNPATGSGTPYLDADGVVGASIIAGAIFGGISTALFVRGKTGRYAAYGRG